MSRELAGAARRFLAERLDRLQEALEGLGGRVREGVASVVGGHVGDAVRDALGAALGRQAQPDRFPYSREPLGRGPYRHDPYESDRYAHVPEDHLDPRDGFPDERSADFWGESPWRPSTPAREEGPRWKWGE